MYISTQYLSKNSQCTYEDKKECIETINQILELANIIRKGFYNDLEKAVKKDNKYSPLLKFALKHYEKPKPICEDVVVELDEMWHFIH